MYVIDILLGEVYNICSMTISIGAKAEDALLLMYMSEQEYGYFNGDYINRQANEHNIATPVITESVQQELDSAGLIKYPAKSRFVTKKGEEVAKEYLRQREDITY